MPERGGTPLIHTLSSFSIPISISTPASATMTTLTARDIKEIVTDVVRMSSMTNSSLRLERFSGRDTRELLKWLREFDYHADANNWDDAAKLCKFPTYLRDYGLLWYDQNVKRTVAEPTTWADLKTLITRDLLSTDHKSYLHTEIMRRRQGNNESVQLHFTES